MRVEILGRLAAGEALSREEVTKTIDSIMQGECSSGEIGLFLVGLALKGETVEEVVGAATALRSNMVGIRSKRQGILDTCGTGGDGSQTFNISTAAALVTAAAGVPVAKHGNRAATSKSGSADVLAELGVNLELDAVEVGRCLDDLSVCFCYARLFHPAMKHVAAVRSRLGIPTIFNLLGPLCNPAAAAYQVLGAGRPNSQDLLAQSLARLGTEHAVVVRGDDGLGEVSIAAPTRVLEVAAGRVQEFAWQPCDFGVAKADERAMSQLIVETPRQSAQLVRGVLAGEPGAARDIVVANAAAALWTARRSGQLGDCADQAREALDSGAAQALLNDLTRR